MQKCGGQILFTSKSVGKTWRFKTPAKMCCTFLGKSAGEAGRVFPALGKIRFWITSVYGPLLEIT